MGGAGDREIERARRAVNYVTQSEEKLLKRAGGEVWHGKGKTWAGQLPSTVSGLPGRCQEEVEEAELMSLMSLS